MRLLIIEDEPDLLNILGKRLRTAGYSVDLCSDGEEGELYMESASYDAVILDVMLPKVDGITLLKRLRAKGDKTHILLLTARDSVDDRVVGLDAGADDYLIKPFSFEELLARIRVLIRRSSETAENTLILADMEMNTQTKKVTRGGHPILLSAREYAILEYMMLNQGAVLSRAQIEEHVWDFDYEGGSNVVDVYIRYLRKKIDEPFEKKLLHTVRGMGYTLRDEG